jgi:hypothetical protein
MKLSQKFKEIQLKAEKSKKLIPINFDEEFNLEEYKEAIAALGSRTHYRLKKINKSYNVIQSEQSDKKKIIRKDPTLEKISFILPDYLMRKLEANY